MKDNSNGWIGQVVEIVRTASGHLRGFRCNGTGEERILRYQDAERIAKRIRSRCPWERERLRILRESGRRSFPYFNELLTSAPQD